MAQGLEIQKLPFKKVIIYSSYELERLEDTIKRRNSKKYVYFLRMSVDFCYDNKENISELKEHESPIFLVLSEGSKEKDKKARDLVEVFTGIVFESDITTHEKGIRMSLEQGYTYLSPTIVIDMGLKIEESKKRKEKIDTLVLNECVDFLDFRDVEIINEILKGLSSKKVSENLFLAQSTISTRLVKVFSLFGVKSKTELVALLVKKGYVTSVRKRKNPVTKSSN